MKFQRTFLLLSIVSRSAASSSRPQQARRTRSGKPLRGPVPSPVSDESLFVSLRLARLYSIAWAIPLFARNALLINLLMTCFFAARSVSLTTAINEADSMQMAVWVHEVLVMLW
ncbi:MAG: hypothetical protein HYR56_15335 [Acidobacteria bacterium]|nr:hypothetical protein [Acidobacteriota bacterium]MBI3426879.1 hypothetical protein [Acidobacteriota bacterium]